MTGKAHRKEERDGRLLVSPRVQALTLHITQRPGSQTGVDWEHTRRVRPQPPSLLHAPFRASTAGTEPTASQPCGRPGFSFWGSFFPGLPEVLWATPPPRAPPPPFGNLLPFLLGPY